MNPPRKSSSADITASSTSGEPLLRESAASAISHFLASLDGETCVGLHDMVMAQVEEPLLRAVLEHTQGNQSKAAAMLGLNRGTLRTKLRRHGLLATPE